MRAAVAGLLYGLAQVGFGIWPLGFGCFALWWSGIAPDRSHRGAFLGGLVFGAVAHSVAMPWLVPAALRFSVGGPTGAAVSLALVAAHTLWIAAGFGLVATLCRAGLARGIPVTAAAPAALVALEALQPQIFHAGAGALLIHAGPLAQLAELVGPLGLTLFVAACNSLLLIGARALEEGDRGAATSALAVFLGAVAAAALFGAIRLGTLDEDAGEALRIGLVQADIPANAERLDAAPAHAAHLEASRAIAADAAAQGGPELLVWPEGAYPRALPWPGPLDGAPIRGSLDIPLLFGANAAVTSGGRRRARNAAFLVDERGRIEQSYAKRILIPLAESPLLAASDEWLQNVLPNAHRFEPGRDASVFTVGPHRIATPICFEITRADAVREFVRESGATLLVTLTDDGWFGTSGEPSMHLALARLRAIETRRWLVRAANRGPSAFVDPAGRLRSATPIFAAATLHETVRSRRDLTLYAWVGDAPALVLALAAAFGLARLDRSARDRA